MKRTWEQEKAYTVRKAQEYGAEMDAAIETVDKDRFNAAFMKSLRYMSKHQQDDYMKRFISKYAPLCNMKGELL